MQTVRSSVALLDYQHSIVEALQDGKCLVFLDTNVIAWSYRLNGEAFREFARWLSNLAQDERLVIPAWTVHEYNIHLLRRDQNFFLPHRSVGKQVKTSLREMDGVAHLLADDRLAERGEFAGRQQMLAAFSEAARVVEKCVDMLAQDDDDRRRESEELWEGIVAKAGLQSDIHGIAAVAAHDSVGRYASRLSPGYEDAAKNENATGDLIIWREILDCCVSRGALRAVLLTNDMKADWVYTPLSVTLPSGKVVDGTAPVARAVRLPKPDMAFEFAGRVSGGALNVLSVNTAVDVLSSSGLNSRDAQGFRHLALAIRLNLARTPTEAVVQWFLVNREMYDEALKGVCGWRESPGEVNQAAFAAWTTSKMKERNERVDSEVVRWGDVFVELFL